MKNGIIILILTLSWGFGQCDWNNDGEINVIDIVSQVECILNGCDIGCTDETSCNYNSNAVVDDGTCNYAEGNYDCLGECVVDVDCTGECGGSAVEDECGVCDTDASNDNTPLTGNCDCNGFPNGEASIDGCGDCVGGDTGLTACANDCLGELGGDAVYDNCDTCDNDSSNDCVQDCADVWGGSTVIDECGECGGDGICDGDEIVGCTYETACNYNPNATIGDDSCLWVDGICETCVDGGIVDNDIDNDDICDTDEISGCMDETSCNYDYTSTDDDGSCIWTDGICETCEDGMIVDNDTDNDGVCNTDEIEGCTDETACNYDDTPTIDTNNDLCIYTDGICETCEDGMIVDNDIDNDDICDTDEISGCIYETACNYNPNATSDDGSCIWTDGICETCVDGMIVDNDINGDGICEVWDYDGNWYEIIQIGEQLWMAENLKVTHYNNGEEIPNITNNGDWVGLSTGAYSDYGNNPTNSETYGRLYNWYTVDDDRGVCPEDYHIPSDAEYTVLTDYLGGESVAGGKMKEAGYEHWDSPNTGATNESGFTGLPAGYRYYYNGTYNYMGYYGYFWSSSESSSNAAWHRELNYDYSYVSRYDYGKQSGFSVRCLGD